MRTCDVFCHIFMTHHGQHLMTAKTGVITHVELSTMKDAFIDDVAIMVKLPSHSGHNGINLVGDV